MNFNNVGEVISSLRKQIGITQDELGNRTGLSRAIIAKVENSQRATSLEEAVTISKALSIDVDTLFAYIEEKEDDKNERKSFSVAFRNKGMGPDELLDVKRIELLMEALIAQKEIHRDE